MVRKKTTGEREWRDESNGEMRAIERGRVGRRDRIVRREREEESE